MVERGRALSPDCMQDEGCGRGDQHGHARPQHHPAHSTSSSRYGWWNRRCSPLEVAELGKRAEMPTRLLTRTRQEELVRQRPFLVHADNIGNADLAALPNAFVLILNNPNRR